jgi:hypothetical protein
VHHSQRITFKRAFRVVLGTNKEINPSNFQAEFVRHGRTTAGVSSSA